MAIASIDPLFVNACTCLDRQVRTGAPMSYSAFFLEASVTTTGALQSYTHRYDFGRTDTSRCCAECGTSVRTPVEALPGHIGIPAGLLRAYDFPAPSKIYFTSRKHDWRVLPPGIKTADTW